MKPILFRQKPDTVHDRLLWIGTRIQNNGIVRKIITVALAYYNDDYLSQTVCGIQFRNPVGLSAGFDKNFELPMLIKSIGFGFMEGGSLTNRPCKGNPRPWFHRLPKSRSLVVYAGLANEGVDKITQRLEAYPANVYERFPLNISVAKTNSREAVTDSEAIDDYISSLKIIKSSGIGNMLTLNISCPNTYGGEPFTTPRKLSRLLSRVDKLRLKQPVFVKMPSDLPWKDFDGLLQVIVLHNVQGVTISNLAKDRGQVELMDPLPDSVRGNLSGKPTWNLSNELIRKTYRKYGDRLTIIGVGGIFSAEDAYQKIKLGSSLVELITGMIYEGPQLIGQINRGIVDLLKADGYSSISEAIGVDNKKPKS